MTKFTISARSVPECQSFLKIRWPDEDFLSIEKFLNSHPDPTLDDLRICDIQYRNIEKNYRDYLSEYVSFMVSTVLYLFIFKSVISLSLHQDKNVFITLA